MIHCIAAISVNNEYTFSLPFSLCLCNDSQTDLNRFEERLIRIAILDLSYTKIYLIKISYMNSLIADLEESF